MGEQKKKFKLFVYLFLSCSFFFEKILCFCIQICRLYKFVCIYIIKIITERNKK
ncbi:hypothetical protein HanXRQr2_Chr12g0549481 [Helianthus annuus]|uniref:Uncharacterized protein n=1 Tax=Helianthus annuus TaxID=4232 RepID=A0A9K3HHT5_HELAN|nr:hypothetical protein HanXRQr2_Chr12g0549481 [Helianthus annuus]KAJ0863358.1 hypothetical protein HanPSC8_Chr12g0529061 [Helianthus annuus]